MRTQWRVGEPHPNRAHHGCLKGNLTSTRCKRSSASGNQTKYAYHGCLKGNLTSTRCKLSAASGMQTQWRVGDANSVAHRDIAHQFLRYNNSPVIAPHEIMS
ncbi:MAG TPA: hypothetical protein PKA85_06080 [Ferruginibacter sp.]|nr:hypothetical protein [Ferruginibacter sp.]